MRKNDRAALLAAALAGSILLLGRPARAQHLDLSVEASPVSYATHRGESQTTLLATSFGVSVAAGASPTWALGLRLHHSSSVQKDRWGDYDDRSSLLALFGELRLKQHGRVTPYLWPLLGLYFRGTAYVNDPETSTFELIPVLGIGLGARYQLGGPWSLGSSVHVITGSGVGSDSFSSGDYDADVTSVHLAVGISATL